VSIPPTADRNLLFGILALQAGMIDPVRLAEAALAWKACPSVPLGDLLVERGWLSPDQKAAVDFLIGLEPCKDPPGRDAAARVERALAALDASALGSTL